jgi:hypothetical protein
LCELLMRQVCPRRHNRRARGYLARVSAADVFARAGNIATSHDGPQTK